MEKLKKMVAGEMHPKAFSRYQSLASLMEELESKELPRDFVAWLDTIVSEVNQLDHSAKSTKWKLHKYRHQIIRRLAKRLKIVPKHYYRNLGMVLGMSAMGLPFGISFGIALDNMAFIAIGIPIGMSVGLAMGTGMDEKAKKEGRQLSFSYDI